MRLQRSSHIVAPVRACTYVNAQHNIVIRRSIGRCHVVGCVSACQRAGVWLTRLPALGQGVVGMSSRPVRARVRSRA
jgi:hypothetical protein